MKKLLLIILLYPFLVKSQVIADTNYYGTSANWIKVISYRNASTSSSIPPARLNDSTATLRTLIATKQNTITNGSISNGQLANSAVANLSGTNSGDNATNSQYSGLGASKINVSDSAAMLANYARTSSVNLKTNLSDTAAMLGGYLRKTGSAATLTNFPTLNQNTTGTAGGLSANIAESQVTNLTTDLAAKAALSSPAFTGTVTTSGSIGITAGAGSGGTVTQLTSRSTGVTLNKISGAITTNNTSLAAGAEATFVVTNSTVAIGDVVLVSARSGQTANTSIPFVTAVAAGSFSITLSNFNAATADTGAMIINFIVIKAVSN